MLVNKRAATAAAAAGLLRRLAAYGLLATCGVKLQGRGDTTGSSPDTVVRQSPCSTRRCGPAGACRVHPDSRAAMTAVVTGPTLDRVACVHQFPAPETRSSVAVHAQADKAIVPARESHQAGWHKNIRLSSRTARGLWCSAPHRLCIAAGQDDQEDRAATVLLGVQGRAHAPHQAVRLNTCICPCNPAAAMRAAYRCSSVAATAGRMCADALWPSARSMPRQRRHAYCISQAETLVSATFMLELRAAFNF